VRHLVPVLHRATLTLCLPTIKTLFGVVSVPVLDNSGLDFDTYRLMFFQLLNDQRAVTAIEELDK